MGFSSQGRWCLLTLMFIFLLIPPLLHMSLYQMGYQVTYERSSLQTLHEVTLNEILSDFIVRPTKDVQTNIKDSENTRSRFGNDTQGQGKRRRYDWALLEGSLASLRKFAGRIGPLRREKPVAPQWQFEQLEHGKCEKQQGCGFLVETTQGYQERSPPVFYRGAPWRTYIGQWLEGNEHSASLTVEEPRYAKPCPGDCIGRGVCNHELGICRCMSGWKGDACDEHDLYPCNYEGTPTEKFGGWVFSRCAATCNQRTHTCECGQGTKHPGRVAPQPFGFVHFNGSYMDHDPEFLYGTSAEAMGWCNADVEDLASGRVKTVPHTGCYYDGYAGRLCEILTQQFCINQCSLRGDCLHGFCKCREGWYGLDCSIPSALVDYETEAEAMLPDVLELPQGGQEENANAVGVLDSRGKAKRRLQQGNIAGMAKMMQEQAGKTAVAEVHRKRPLIYVYDLPPELHMHHLQKRIKAGLCATRWYDLDNVSKRHPWVFGSEVAILEEILSSEHRTLNAEEADYFLVPLLGSCMALLANNSPRYFLENSHSYLMARQYKMAYDHIRYTYPYFDRHGGRDHLWVNAHDEGACSLPKEIKDGIMLTQWGNTAKDPKSSTSFFVDFWDNVPESFRGNGPCYDPAKDFVLPFHVNLGYDIIQTRGMYRKYEERPRLFYYAGNLGDIHDMSRPLNRRYSWGVRQEVAKYFRSRPNDVNNKTNVLGLLHEPDVEVTHVMSTTYHEDLSKTKFCGAFPGESWSARVEEAVLNGCIPVIIMDGIHQTYENILDYSQFAVRIAEKDIPNMVKILRAIPEAEVRAKLEVVQKMWARFTYRGSFILEAQRQRELNRGVPEPFDMLPELLQGDDCLQTLMQFLHYKLYNDPWRLELEA